MPESNQHSEPFDGYVREQMTDPEFRAAWVGIVREGLPSRGHHRLCRSRLPQGELSPLGEGSPCNCNAAEVERHHAALDRIEEQYAALVREKQDWLTQGFLGPEDAKRLKEQNESLRLRVEISEAHERRVEEQLELLAGFLRDEADAGLPLPVPIRRIIDASNPAKERS